MRELLIQVVGIFLLVEGVGILLNRAAYQKYCAEVAANQALLMFGGAVSLVVGLLLVFTHNVWEANVSVIVTIVGWIALVKGVAIALFPETIKVVAIKRANEELVIAGGIILTVVGLYMSYVSFFA